MRWDLTPLAKVLEISLHLFIYCTLGPFNYDCMENQVNLLWTEPFFVFYFIDLQRHDVCIYNFIFCSPSALCVAYTHGSSGHQLSCWHKHTCCMGRRHPPCGIQYVLPCCVYCPLWSCHTKCKSNHSRVFFLPALFNFYVIIVTIDSINPIPELNNYGIMV